MRSLDDNGTASIEAAKRIMRITIGPSVPNKPAKRGIKRVLGNREIAEGERMYLIITLFESAVALGK